MLTGTNLVHAKAYNDRIVLETVRLHGPISRAEVARHTELTAQTVSNIARRLMAAGLIQETHRLQEGRGAPAMALQINPEGAFSIGLDLDKDHLTGVLVDLVGNVRQRLHHPLHFPPPDEANDLMETTARELIRREGLLRDRIWGVGVGIPGPLGITEGSVVTNVVNPKAFPGWEDVPVRAMLNERLALPIYLENNATAAAVGERWYGAGRDVRTFFYVYLAVGLGGGLIINGHPYEGFMGNAGELGYIPVLGGAADAAAAFQRPHLGVYFNLPRLYRLLEEHDVHVSSPSELADLYKAQHPTLLEWLDTGVRHLAPIILAIEYLLDPERLFFGGTWPEALIRAVLDRLEHLLPALRIDSKMYVPQILQATAGVDAAALGVATLPMYESFAPIHGLLAKGDKGRTSNRSPVEARNHA